MVITFKSTVLKTSSATRQLSCVLEMKPSAVRPVTSMSSVTCLVGEILHSVTTQPDIVTVTCLSIGTLKSSKFSICPKWCPKI